MIKVNGQAAFFVWWFRNPQVVVDLAVSVVDSLPDAIPLDAEMVRDKLNQALEQVTQGEMKEGEVSWPKFIGEKVVLLAILMFALSCVNQFAQQRQKTLDEAKIEKMSK